MIETEMRRDRWGLWVFLMWIAAMIGLIIWRWGRIHWLALGDTDDNLRLMEVRAWLDGQGWYDLRQYRLNPPEGFNIHWSRLVDIPIAGIIVLVKPFFGTAIAERAAIGIAPILPLGVTFLGLALTVRRLVAPWSYLFAIAILMFGAQWTLGMFQPARIDHHGWQLAMLGLIVAGLSDPDRRRGGLLAGGASILSLVIGLEMLPYLAVAGAAVALFWIWEKNEAARLQTYGITLAGGAALGYLIFASYDNAAPRCDVLSPVWMSTMILSGALLTVLARLPLRSRAARFAGGIVAGAIIAGFFALAWPQCLGRPESASPELQAKWLDNIREVKPVYRQEWRTMIFMLTLPALGLLGGAMSIVFNRRNPHLLRAWCGVTALGLCGLALLFFQSRAAAAAQLLAIPGCVSLLWITLPWIRNRSNMLVRVFGTVALFLAASGLLVQFVIESIPKKAEKPVYKKVNLAGARCSTIPSMHPLDKLPKATIMTMVDLGPRLITLTHHDAIAGPYHRNGDAILDIHHAFDGTPAVAHAVAKKHGATLLMICPNFAEGTVYKSRSPKGFYAQLEAGKVPDWLEPVTLNKNSPFKLWRIKP